MTEGLRPVRSVVCPESLEGLCAAPPPTPLICRVVLVLASCLQLCTTVPFIISLTLLCQRLLAPVWGLLPLPHSVSCDLWSILSLSLPVLRLSSSVPSLPPGASTDLACIWELWVFVSDSRCLSCTGHSSVCPGTSLYARLLPLNLETPCCGDILSLGLSMGGVLPHFFTFIS